MWFRPLMTSRPVDARGLLPGGLVDDGLLLLWLFVVGAAAAAVAVGGGGGAAVAAAAVVGVDATAVQDHFCSTRSSDRRRHLAAAASRATPTTATIGSAVCAAFSHAFVRICFLVHGFCASTPRLRLGAVLAAYQGVGIS